MTRAVYEQQVAILSHDNEPVELLLVLLLQTEDDLHRASTLRDFATLSDNDVRGVPLRMLGLLSCDSEARPHSLEDVRGYVLATDGVFRNTFLVAAHL